MHLFIDGMGTLVRLDDPVGRLVATLAARLGVHVPRTRARRALAAEIAHYRAHLHEGSDAESLAALRRRCALVLAGALGPPLDSADPARMTDVLLTALRFAAYPDARDALIDARAAGARVIVVSNWDVSLLEVLEWVGLAPLLDGVVTSAAVGAAKPDPAIFAHALALAGVAPEAVVHVGDSVHEDVAGASAAGIAPVLLHRSGERPGAPAGPAAAAPAAAAAAAAAAASTGVPVIAGLGELHLVTG